MPILTKFKHPCIKIREGTISPYALQMWTETFSHFKKPALLEIYRIDLPHIQNNIIDIRLRLFDILDTSNFCHVHCKGITFYIHQTLYDSLIRCLPNEDSYFQFTEGSDKFFTYLKIVNPRI